MRQIALGLLIMGLLGQAAAADEFEEVVEDALAAYRDGDIAVAREELEYAVCLLSDPFDGGTRENADAEAGRMAMAMMGGGTHAAASYRRSEEEFTLTLIARSPMVSSTCG